MKKELEIMVEKVLEIAVSAPALQAKPRLPMSCDESKKRRWLEKWIRMQANHPQLRSLENSLWAFCKDYAKQPNRGRRLLIFGNNGCGKSHSAKAVYRWASRLAIDLPLCVGDDGIRLSTAEYVHWQSFIKHMMATKQWDASEALKDPDLLVLDDIGSEHDPSGFAKSELSLVLEQRETSWMIMTTNFGPDAWDDRFDRRIASRFLRNCDIVDLSRVPDWGARE